MTDAWKHEAEISGRTIEEVKSDLWEKPIGTLQQCFGRLFVAMTQALLLTQETYHRYMMTCTNPCDFFVALSYSHCTLLLHSVSIVQKKGAGGTQIPSKTFWRCGIHL